MLPPFEPVHRVRRVEPLAPHATELDLAVADGRSATGRWPLPSPAPYVAVVADLSHSDGVGDDRAGDGRPVALSLVAGAVRLTAEIDGRRRGTALEVRTGRGRPTRHRSRRHGRARSPRRLALLLTGDVVSLLTEEPAPGAPGGAARWVVRARVDLADRVEVGDPGLLAALAVEAEAGPGAVTRLRAGGAGQLGLRDVRAVTAADGTPLREGRRLWLTATCAGPGFAPAGHTGVWLLDPVDGSLEHTGDLFATRAGDDRVHGDHATHLLRDPHGPGWLVASSTWGGFVAGRPGHRVDATWGRVAHDPRRGRHVVETAPLSLPVDGLRSVGTWDPHLVHRRGGWEVGFVSATAYFRFGPAWAHGPDLDHLALRGADPARTATEGTTLADLGDGAGLRLLVSDGRDGPRGLRRRFAVLDERVREVGTLEAAYPSNIPWPTLVPATRGRDGHDGWWMVTFDGTPAGGRLPGYGTHGDLLVLRARHEDGRAAP